MSADAPAASGPENAAATETKPESPQASTLLDVPQDDEHGRSSAASVSDDAATEVGAFEKGDVEKEAEVTTPPPEEPPRNISGFLWILVVFAILSSTFLFALDNTIVADVQPEIVERFNSVNKLPWLSVSFLLGALGSNLIWGKLYGQFNAKYLYLGNLVLFEAGSALCGGAPNIDALIVGRAMCGVGGAGVYVGVMTLLSLTTTLAERPMYIGFTGLTWGAGTVLGPIIGGSFAANHHTTWRWAFYINLVIGAVFAPVYIFLLPSRDVRAGTPWKERVRHIDYAGSILFIGSMVSLTMAISFGGVLYAWDSGRIIGLFCCGGALLILFALQQVFAILTNVDDRIFPVELLKSRTLIILFIQIGLASGTLFVPLYFIPLFFQFTRSDSALEAGVRLLPIVCLLVFFVILNGIVMSLPGKGYYMPWYLAGGILGLIGSALMYTVGPSSSTSRVYGYSVLIGIGTGCFLQSGFGVAQTKVTPNKIPNAVGFITCGQILGVTLTLCMANAIFLNKSVLAIQSLLPTVPRAQIQSTVSGVGSGFFESLTSGQQAAVLAAIVHAMSKVYILCITAASMTIVLALFMKRERILAEPGHAG